MLAIRINIFFIFIAIVSSSAQVQISSPISILGFGQLIDSDNSFVSSVGGTRASFHAPDQLNGLNPASLGHLQTTVFSSGLSATRTLISQDGQESKIWSGNLSYLSLGMTLQNQFNALLERKESKIKWGMSFSLRPYAITGYDFESFDAQTGRDTLLLSYTGEGSSYIVSWSNGWKYKNFSFGLTGGYLFGSNTLSQRISFPESIIGQGYSYNTIESTRTDHKGLTWNMGMMYDHVFKHETRADGSRGRPNKYLTLGLTYHGEWKLNTEENSNLIRQNTQVSSSISSDTLLASNNLESRTTIPEEFNFGISYIHLNKLRIGVNFQQSIWSDYRNTQDDRTSSTRDAFFLSGGISYIPNATSITNYMERVTYTLAAKYGQDPRVLNGEQLKTYEAKIGVMLPFVGQRQVSYLNLNVGYGRLGTANGYRENYWTFGLGYALTDNQWFIKRKYD